MYYINTKANERKTVGYKKPCNIVCIILLTAHLMSLWCYISVSANSAEAPGFTIIVLNSRENLSLSLQLPNDSLSNLRIRESEKKGWEKYYKVYFHYRVYPPKSEDIKDIRLIVQSSSKSFQCTLPEGTFDQYNNILTLDMNSETLTVGQSPLRVPALVALRVILTLLIEGAVFFLFGYRQKKSWLVFVLVNLLTQGGLNAMLTGPNLSNYWILGYIFGEIVVLIVEIIAFLSLIKEYRKRRVAFFVIIANTASLILGDMLITYLPV